MNKTITHAQRVALECVLKMLQTGLDNVPDSAFRQYTPKPRVLDLKRWRVRGSRGSRFCIGGLAEAASGEDFFLDTFPRCGGVLVDPPHPLTPLFYPPWLKDGDDTQVTEAQAAKLLARFLHGDGVVDWEWAMTTLTCKEALMRWGDEGINTRMRGIVSKRIIIEPSPSGRPGEGQMWVPTYSSFLTWTGYRHAREDI